MMCLCAWCGGGDEEESGKGERKREKGLSLCALWLSNSVNTIPVLIHKEKHGDVQTRGPKTGKDQYVQINPQALFLRPFDTEFKQHPENKEKNLREVSFPVWKSGVPRFASHSFWGGKRC